MGSSNEMEQVDLIDRQAAIDALTHKWDGMVTSVFDVINSLPSAQPELSLEQVLEYCRSRCITVVEDEVLYKRLDSAYTEGYTFAESKYRKIFDEFLGIVFCKDCKHWRHDDHICQYYGGASPRVAIDFCSKGERRTNEDD